MQTKTLDEIDINLINYNKNVDYNSFRKITTQQLECFYNREKTIFTYKDRIQEQSLSDNIIVLSKSDFTNLIIKLYKDYIKTFCLNTRKNHRSVKYFNVKKFKRTCIILVFFISALCFINSLCIKLLVITYYIICMTIKNTLLLYSYKNLKNIIQEPPSTDINSDKAKLPVYTILVPIFHENKNTILQLINSINSIEYPKDLLDIKLILEEDDYQSKEILKNIDVPDSFTLIFVPYFEPRTKPKACNVAALFAFGDIIVIFDCEDIPDKKQLLYATEKLNRDKTIQILQSCLQFYNSNENILTKCFNIEYSIWFKFILKTLSDINITLPLGGTSNYIRYTSDFEKLYWDSYNVTEDLELSVIYDKNKIKIKHLYCDTEEWCTSNIKSFIKQRTRWIKGYLLTYFTHIGKYKTFDIKKMIFFHVIIGFSGLSFLLLPVLSFSLMSLHKYTISYICLLIGIIYSIISVCLYFLITKQKQKTPIISKINILAIYPFYFLLHTISAFIAFFEIFKKPYYWSKTQHNIN